MKKDKASLDRRKFLSTGAIISGMGVIGLNAGLSSCAGEKGKKKIMDLILPSERAPDGEPLKAGLVGCGHRGTAAAIDFLNAGPNLSVVAAADVFQDQIDKFRQNLKELKGVELEDDKCFVGFDAYKRLLETDVDVVLLATHGYFRPQQLSACVDARKHVFIEKPVAVDPVGTRSVMASSKQAEEAGLCIVSGTQRRHSFDYMSVQNRVSQGEIGGITSLQTYWMGGGRRKAKPSSGKVSMEEMIRNPYSWTWLSGGLLVDPHIHYIDVANWFMGKAPVSAMGMGTRVVSGPGTRYDMMCVDFVYEKEVHMNSFSRSILGCSGRWDAVIRGTEGYTNTRNTIWDPEGNIMYEYPYKNEEEKKGLVMRVGSNQYEQEHVDLVTAIRTGKQIVEAEETALSNMTCIMGREAAYGGQVVSWDEMMSSDLKLGPENIKWGPVDIDYNIPVPGIQKEVA